MPDRPKSLDSETSSIFESLETRGDLERQEEFGSRRDMFAEFYLTELIEVGVFENRFFTTGCAGNF